MNYLLRGIFIDIVSGRIPGYILLSLSHLIGPVKRLWHYDDGTFKRILSHDFMRGHNED